jgi:FMN phosphatase YigB (HAD superfamily)
VKAVIFDYKRTIFDPDTNGLVSGALELLTALKGDGVKLFLIVKGDAERRGEMERLGILPFFDEIIINPHKSAEDYQRCTRLCPPGTQFFAVGDRVREEIRHANACGMTTIWLKRGKFSVEEPTSADEQPSFTVTELSQAKAIIL